MPRHGAALLRRALLRRGGAGRAGTAAFRAPPQAGASGERGQHTAGARAGWFSVPEAPSTGRRALTAGPAARGGGAASRREGRREGGARVREAEPR